jgi:tetratricopeptide (TPR) repeat protein
MPLDPLSALTSARQRLDALYVPAGLSSPAGGERASPIPPPSPVDSLLSRQPDDPQREVLLGLVRDALEAGHTGAALELLDRLWSAELSREDCWYLRGQALYELKRYREAGDVAGRGLERLPRSVALLFLLSNCELKLQNLAGAERAILDALALVPEHPVLLCRYAALLVRSGRTEEASRLLDRADGVAPDHPLVLLERAAQAAAGLGTGGEPQIIESQVDPYVRAGVGLSLLGLAAATGSKASPSRAPGEGMVVLRGALVGLAIALAAFGLRVPAAIAFVTALAVPRLWRARG